MRPGEVFTLQGPLLATANGYAGLDEQIVASTLRADSKWQHGWAAPRGIPKRLEMHAQVFRLGRTEQDRGQDGPRSRLE